MSLFGISTLVKTNRNNFEGCIDELNAIFKQRGDGEKQLKMLNNKLKTVNKQFDGLDKRNIAYKEKQVWADFMEDCQILAAMNALFGTGVVPVAGNEIIEQFNSSHAMSKNDLQDLHKSNEQRLKLNGDIFKM